MRRLRRSVDPVVRVCAKVLSVRSDEPHLVVPRLDPGVPVLSLGRYAGARREAIIAVKEQAGQTSLSRSPARLGQVSHT